MSRSKFYSLFLCFLTVTSSLACFSAPAGAKDCVKFQALAITDVGSKRLYVGGGRAEYSPYACNRIGADAQCKGDFRSYVASEYNVNYISMVDGSQAYDSRNEADSAINQKKRHARDSGYQVINTSFTCNAR